MFILSLSDVYSLSVITQAMTVMSSFEMYIVLCEVNELNEQTLYTVGTQIGRNVDHKNKYVRSAAETG